MFKKTIQSQLPFVFLGKFSDQPSSLAASSSSPDLWNEVCFARIWCSFVGTWEDAESGPCAHSSWEWGGWCELWPSSSGRYLTLCEQGTEAFFACLPALFFFKRKTNQNNLHVSSEFIGNTGSADRDSSFEGGTSSFLQPPRLPSTSLVLCPPFHHPCLLCLCSNSVAGSPASGCSLETF